MINTETIERSGKMGSRILKKLAMFGVAMPCGNGFELMAQF